MEKNVINEELLKKYTEAINKYVGILNRFIEAQDGKKTAEVADGMKLYIDAVVSIINK